MTGKHAAGASVGVISISSLVLHFVSGVGANVTSDQITLAISPAADARSGAARNRPSPEVSRPAPPPQNGAAAPTNAQLPQGTAPTVRTATPSGEGTHLGRIMSKPTFATVAIPPPIADDPCIRTSGWGSVVSSGDTRDEAHKMMDRLLEVAPACSDEVGEPVVLRIGQAPNGSWGVMAISRQVTSRELANRIGQCFQRSPNVIGHAFSNPLSWYRM